MRRMIPVALAATLMLAATPVMATDEEAATEEAATQRFESTEWGLSLELPADWNVSTPEGLRVSALTNADGEDVMETTVVYANAGGGTWCDVDAYVDLSPEAGLEGHAFAYVSYLQETEGPESAMVVGEEEVAGGPAYRVEIFEQDTGRIRAMYLFDGAADEDGTFNRYLLMCASRDASTPFWEAIAGSAEVTVPVSADPLAEDGEDTAEEADTEDMADDEMTDDAEDMAGSDEDEEAEDA